MMVRKFSLLEEDSPCTTVGGLFVIDGEYNVEDLELADSRVFPDEDVVDCSGRMFELTNLMAMISRPFMECTVFNARRFRNLRHMTGATKSGGFEYDMPTFGTPLLYIGNPIRVTKDLSGITVYRLPEFLIKSGMQLEAEMER
jgi:hypothetical protein